MTRDPRNEREFALLSRPISLQPEHYAPPRQRPSAIAQAIVAVALAAMIAAGLAHVYVQWWAS